MTKYGAIIIRKIEIGDKCYLKSCFVYYNIENSSSIYIIYLGDEFMRILKNELSLMEILAEKIIFFINKRLNKEGLELQKMKLGVEILLINVSKMIIICTLATIFNLLKETILISMLFAFIRSTSFGLHAKNSIVCTIVTSIMFIGGSYLSNHLRLNNYNVIVISTILSILLYKYAPADTENHPLLGEDFREKLRKKTILKAMILMVIAIIVPSNIKTLITLALLEQTLSILPITYKLLKRGYKNYEKYERCIN